MKEDLLRTLLHILELLVVVAVAWVLVSLFQIDSESAKIAIGLVLAALAKFARASDLSPVPDYTR